MRNCIDKWFLYLMMAIICFLLADNVRLRNIGNNWQIHHQDTVFIEKSDTVWKDTTVIKTKLIPKYEYLVRVDTVYDKEGKEIELLTENKIYQDTILCGEKDTAEVRIITSGIKSSVDSVFLKLRKSEITKTNTIEITKYIEKKKTFKDRIKFVPNISFGYGLINKQWDISVGGGVGIEL